MRGVSESATTPLLLASTSVHRRRLLERFGVPFECVAPAVEETRLAGEAPHAMAARLARAKALDVARQCGDAVVIGSDQVAVRGAEILGKPGDAERCRSQLAASSGRELLAGPSIRVFKLRLIGTYTVTRLKVGETFRSGRPAPTPPG